MRRRSLIAAGAVAALLADVAGFVGLTQPANSATQWLTGVDISHWNGTINWTSVAGSGIKFVIQKATEGRSYVDPTYTTNRSGASGAGIKFTGYHFARPDTTSGDAVTEADHFVDTAQLTAGNLIPALDLEVTGGLGVSALQNWTMAWLNRVTQRLRVKPMIYTSPYFWKTYLGDTQSFATAGYKTLWIAHWGVSSPSVPANNWGGYGWTFWQWTDCWHVTGISGCVDGDRFNGTSLTPVTIPKLSVSKTQHGSVSSSPSGISCGTTCQSIYNPGTVVSLAPTPDSGAVFVSWGGACSGSSSCTVTMMGNKSVTASFGFMLTTAKSGTGTGTLTSSPPGISCGSTCQWGFVTGSDVTLTASAGADSAFTGWSGACSGTSSTCTVTMSEAKSVTAAFADLRLPRVTIAAPTTLTGGLVATFSEIVRPVTTANFLLKLQGGSSPMAAALTCRNGSGSVVDCSTGNVISATLRPSTALVPGQYYSVEVDPSGVHPQISDLDSNPVDPTTLNFRGPRSQQENTPAATYAWAKRYNSNAYDGSYRVEHKAGAKASFTFTGTGITWYTVTGPSQGLAYVYIDGVSKGSFNQYASSSHFKVARSFSGLSSSTHTIQIVVRGLKGSSAGTNSYVSVDAFKVGTDLFGTPAAIQMWRRQSSSSASGGYFATTDLRGSVSFTFRGTRVDWYTVVGPDQGMAEMLIDGVLKKTVDNYAASRAYGVRRTVQYLSDAVHTLTIRVLGQKRSASSGRLIGVDRFVVV